MSRDFLWFVYQLARFLVLVCKSVMSLLCCTVFSGISRCQAKEAKIVIVHDR